MSSISPMCQILKDEYDACFNSWFKENYLKGDTTADMCTNLFKKYQACIKEAIKEHNITLWQPEQDPILMPTGDTAFDIRNPDDMHRQSSRSTTLVDGIDCLVQNNDLALENEALNQANEPRRGSSGSRREPTSRRNNDEYYHRTTRHSPTSSSRKRPASPTSARHPSTSVTTPRPHHHHYHPTHRQHRSPSPSPPRHHRSSRAMIPGKRPRSHSRSPQERRPSTRRSRQLSPRERTVDDELMAISVSEEQQQQKLSSKSKRDEDNLQTDKVTPVREPAADLSLVSEDESSRTIDSRPNGTNNEQSSAVTNTNRHSTPSMTIPQATNSSALELSTIVQDCELSLFANSALSTNNLNAGVIRTPSTIFPANDLTQTIELINKYKLMQAQPSNDSHINAWNKEIFVLIQRQIELQRKELDHREREMLLRDRELAEREKRLNERSNDPIPVEPLVPIQPPAISSLPSEEKSLSNVETISNEETNIKTISSIVVEPIKAKNGFKQTPKHRSLATKINPAIFSASKSSTSAVDLYSNDDEEDLPTSINQHKVVLTPTEPSASVIEIDPKVNSSGFSRKVEFQSGGGGTGDKSITVKTSSHDLRLTLTKHRQYDENSNGNDNHSQDSTNNNDDETNKTVPNKHSHSKDEKQRSRDYAQRSVTSTPIEMFPEKRDYHHQRSGRQQAQFLVQTPNSMYSLPTNIAANDRSYPHASVPQQQARYGSNHRRHESDDLRSHLFEQTKQHPKPSRTTTHRNNY